MDIHIQNATYYKFYEHDEGQHEDYDPLPDVMKHKKSLSLSRIKDIENDVKPLNICVILGQNHGPWKYKINGEMVKDPTLWTRGRVWRDKH